MKQPGKQPKPGVSPRLISRARDFKANFLEPLFHKDFCRGSSENSW